MATSTAREAVGKPRSSGKYTEISTTTQDDSSESEGETEPAKSFHRRISTNKEIKTSRCIKDGYLMKQTSSFQRWRKRYFKLKGRKLYYAKDTKSMIFDEIELTDLSVAECSTKNVNHSFQVITPFRNLVLCADSRKEMEDWIMAMKKAANREYYEPNADHREMLSGQHNWYACSHARPTYCNVCRDALSGVTSHGLSCEVCKFKAHKRCAVRAQNNCKWTTLSSVGRDIMEADDGTLASSHQWLEGNLPVSAKCVYCDKTCGSVLRLQDWRCLWCKAMVHTSCKEYFSVRCPLGPCRVSVLAPICINNLDSDGFWEATKLPGTSPLLVFVNSKSGDNLGVKFLRRFKQLLNPAQVFDLINCGPEIGLKLFQKFDPFRILVCGGDGSIGWVLNKIDKLGLHRQCQVGVLPLGTGNDLARVLGWGAAFDDDNQLSAMLEKLEHAQIKMLDRWSIMTYEGTMPPPRKLSQQLDPISMYEDSVANHLSKILHSDDHAVVISSAKVLCETVKNFVAKVGASYEKEEESEDSISGKCAVLQEKLNALLNTLNKESEASTVKAGKPSQPQPPEEYENDHVPEGIKKPRPTKSAIFKPRDALMHRANSLKKAIRQIIEHTEKAVDEQNAQTLVSEIVQTYAEATSFTNTLTTSPRPPTTASVATLPTFSFNICEDDPSHGSSSGVDVNTPVGSLSPPASMSPPGGCTPESLSPSPRRSKKDLLGPPSPRMGGSRRISSMSTLSRDRSPTKENKSFPIVGLNAFPALPSLASGIASSLAGGSFISKVLLANADALCAAASPLMEEEIALDDYEEKVVMNNYFGIGLDAKISLDFHHKREEHPEKCRSRTKNLMWYGVLGTREFVQQTFKNLDQRVQLECDGQRIPLPSLQGIVILNIPSYMGGTNFWGGSKEDDNFTAPSFDDKILEVVAVFGSVQLGISKVINLQHHRIAQCRSVKVTIMGDEGVPVQVDGEAWVQPPGYIRIVHKNRAQMLTRDKVFEEALKSWSEKQKEERPLSARSHALSDEEAAILHSFVEATEHLMKSVRVAAITHSSVEQELFHLCTQTCSFLEKLYPSGRLSEPTIRAQVSDLVNSVRTLFKETTLFLSEKASSVRLRPDIEEKMSASLAHLEVEMKKVYEIGGLPHFQTVEEELGGTELKRVKDKNSKFKLFRKGHRHKEKEKLDGPSVFCVHEWTTEEVGQWLETIGLSEYRDVFIRNDIRGPELLNLERRDLKDIGVTKVGHLKRIQQGIKDISNRMSALDKTATVL